MFMYKTDHALFSSPSILIPHGEDISTSSLTFVCSSSSALSIHSLIPPLLSSPDLTDEWVIVCDNSSSEQPLHAPMLGPEALDY